jgi:hypothetical protein
MGVLRTWETMVAYILIRLSVVGFNVGMVLIERNDNVTHR